MSARIAHYEALEYAWRIGKEAKSLEAYREALRKILGMLHQSSTDPKGPQVNFRHLINDLPIIPHDILKALKS